MLRSLLRDLRVCFSVLWLSVSFLGLLSSSADASGLEDAFAMSASGMRAQSERMKIVAQNIANIDSTGATPGAEPYRRKTIMFQNRYDRKAKKNVLIVKRIGEDHRADFRAKYDPEHPAANADGYVLLPNVKSSVEQLDMKEAERGYNANLGAIEVSKEMFNGTLDLLR